MFTFLKRRKRTNVAGNDAKWHHVCLMWTSEGGRISLHYDKRTLEGDGFAAGEKIPGKMYEKQDRALNRFEKAGHCEDDRMFCQFSCSF